MQEILPMRWAIQPTLDSGFRRVSPFPNILRKHPNVVVAECPDALICLPALAVGMVERIMLGHIVRHPHRRVL